MIVNKQVSSDLIGNGIAIFILMLGFMPMMLGDYAVYALVLMLPLMWAHGFLKFTENSVICLVFGLFFGFAYRMHEDIPLSSLVMYCLFPFVAYQSGQYMFKRFKSTDSFLVLFAVLTVCMALHAIILCTQDYLETGNIVNVTRTIGFDEDVWDKDAEAEGLGATNMGVLVSILLGTFGIILVRAYSGAESIVKIIAVAGGILGLYVTVHLLNRTGLIIIVLSVMVGFTRPPLSAVKVGIGLLTVTIICSLLFLILRNSELLQMAMDGYADRNSVVGYGIGSAGGRTDRWAAALAQIPMTPFGSAKLEFPGETSYAHNMWLDTFIIGGWIPGVLLIVMTVRYLKRFYKVIRYKVLDRFQTTYVLLVGSVMIIQSMVEPILQSNFPYFCLLLFFWAFVNDLSYSDIAEKAYGERK